MVEQTPIDETTAKEVVIPTGFSTGLGFDAISEERNAKAKADAAARHAAGQEAIDAANASFTKDFDKFVTALKRALGDSISKTHLNTALANGSLKQVSNTVTVTGGIDGHTEFTANNGGSTYYVTENGVFHKDKNTVVSPEEAFNSATLINMNAKAHKEGITISGNNQQKAMYYQAYLDLKNTLGDQAPKLNNQAEIDAIPTADMQRAAQEYAAFKKAQEAELKIEKSKYPPDSEKHVSEDIDNAEQIKTFTEGRIPENLYAGLIEHVQAEGKATNAVIEDFLASHKGVTNKNIDIIRQDAAARLVADGIVSEKPIFGGTRTMRVINKTDAFNTAASGTIEGKPLLLTPEQRITPEQGEFNRAAHDVPKTIEGKPLLLTPEQRITPEQGEFNGAAHDVPKTIDEAPNAGLLRILARMPSTPS